MSRAKFEAAKELIQQKNYSAARAILEAMPDEPRAVEWLAKLDQTAPPKTGGSEKSEKVTVNMLDAQVVCVKCHHQALQHLERTPSDVQCPKCRTKFSTLLVKVRSKRWRADNYSRNRFYSVRVLINDRQEELIEFNARDRGDFDLHSGDLALFSYWQKKVTVVQNLTVARFMIVKPIENHGCARLIIVAALILIALAVGMVLLTPGHGM